MSQNIGNITTKTKAWKPKGSVKTKIIYLSLFAALSTMGLKFVAYLLTGSVGLLSDAIESIVNLVAALAALIAVAFAARPPDANHPYGHEKAEYLSSGLEGGMILLAALTIIWTAIPRLFTTLPLEALGWGLAVSLGATLINLIVGQVLIRVGKKEDSIALEADGKHLMTDVWTSVGVGVGLGLVWLTNWLWLDALVAIGVAINILIEGGRLILRSLDGLLDRALPHQEVKAIEETISQALLNQTGVEYHALRTRKSGNVRFIDFHLLVPGKWSTSKSHNLVEEVEKSLHSNFPNSRILIHLEPIEDPRSYEADKV
jgi:cation diffusion facilitator family transporter